MKGKITEEVKDLAAPAAVVNGALATMDAVDPFAGVKMDVTKFAINRLFLAQSQTTLVKEKKAKGGDILVSQDARAVAGEDEPTGFLVVHAMPDTSYIERLDKTKWVKDREEPFKNRTFEFVDADGQKKRHYRSINFIILLEKESGPRDRPYLINFRKSSRKAGEELFTQSYIMMNNARLLGDKEAAPESLVFNLSSKLSKNKDGDIFHIYAVAQAKPADKEQKATAVRWRSILATQGVDIAPEPTAAETEFDASKEERF